MNVISSLPASYCKQTEHTALSVYMWHTGHMSVEVHVPACVLVSRLRQHGLAGDAFREHKCTWNLQGGRDARGTPVILSNMEV